MTFSNNFVHSLTVVSSVAIPYMIPTLCYSQASDGVVDCSFNCISEIYNCSSNWTRSISSIDSLTTATSFWIFSVEYASVAMLSSGSALHACVIYASKCWFHVENSSFFHTCTLSSHIFWLLVLTSLMTSRARY